MEFIGTGGATLSLGLSLYNTNQILSIKSDLESLIKTDKTEIPQTSPISVIEKATVPEIIFKESESDEINELQASVKELEIFSNTLSTQASTNSSNISIKSDEIENLNVFVGNQFIDLRGRIAVIEDKISSNLSDIEKINTEISSITDEALATNDRIDATITAIEALSASTDVISERVTSSESNITKLSNDLTQRGLDIDSLGDELGLQSDLIGETRLSLDNMYSLWNGFNETAFVADDVLTVSSINASNCKLGLSRDNGSKSAIHFNTLGSTNYSMYMAQGGVGIDPNGKTAGKHGEVTGHAIRTRLGSDSNDGFIFENSEGTGIVSISSTGVTQINNAKIGEVNSGTVGFSHKSRYGGGFLQKSDGKCSISAGNSKTIELLNNGNRVFYTTSGKAVVIENDDSTNSTVFNSKGDNYIRSKDGGSVYFSWGTSSPTVEINNKQIIVDGTDLLAEILSLKTQVAALQSKSYILNGDEVRIRNDNNNKLLRKATTNNSALMDNTSKDSRSLWTLTLV